MKYKFYILATVLCVLLTSQGQAQQNWLWTKAGTGGNSTDEGQSVATDINGNVYITGGYWSSSITFGTFTLTNVSGSSQVYLVKYDSIGNVLWAKTSDSPIANFYGNMGMHVITDYAGNVFLTGSFATSSIYFDTDTLTNNGGFSTFLVKYDSNGNVLWAKSEGAAVPGGNSSTMSNSVADDSLGNVYITGYFTDSTITIGSTVLINNGYRDIFLIKYDTNGNVIWAKGAGGTLADMANSVAIDNSNNVFITGMFHSPILVFGQDTLYDDITLYNKSDIFLTKYDSNGNPLWALRSGGSENDASMSVATFGNNNVYLSGYFTSPTILFGTTTLTHVGGAINGFEDIFITRFDGNGNVLWAKSAGGLAKDWGSRLATDANNNCYLVGGFNSDSIQFGSSVLMKPIANCFIACDPAFIVKYDSTGNVLCADALSSGGDDIIAVATDAFNNAYVSGDYLSNPFIVGTDTLYLTGNEAIFTSKYKCPGTTSINEAEINSDIIIYPNPTSDELTVSGLQFPVQIKIYDVIGKLFLTSQVSISNNKVKTESLPTGIYVYEISNIRGVIMKGKVVKD